MNNNIKPSRLSLKSLQTELEQLKQKSSSQPNSILPYPNKGFKIFNPFIIITLILTYAHKIPIIGKTIKILKSLYGKTTWWKLLGYFRQAFILVNAIIGFFSMFDFQDAIDKFTILKMFYAYLAKLKTYGGNILEWVLYKVGLTPKSDPANYPTPKYPNDGGFTTDQINRIRELQRQKVELVEIQRKLDELESKSTNRGSWFNWILGNSTSFIPDWAWYGGLAIIGAGVLFIGYKLITDPFGFTNRSGRAGSTGAGPDITINDATTGAPNAAADAARGVAADSIRDPGGFMSSGWFDPIRTFTNSIIPEFARNIAGALNPFASVSTQAEMDRDFNAYLSSQDVMKNSSDRRFYPFTANNPNDSWLTKIRKAVLGENNAEYQLRKTHESDVWEQYRILGYQNEPTSALPNIGLVRAEAQADNPNEPSVFSANWPKSPGHITPADVGLSPTFQSDNSLYDAVNNANLKAKLAKEAEKQGENLSDVWSSVPNPPKTNTSGLNINEKTGIPTSGVVVQATHEGKNVDTSNMEGAPEVVKLEKPSTTYVDPKNTSDPQSHSSSGISTPESEGDSASGATTPKHPDLDSPTENVHETYASVAKPAIVVSEPQAASSNIYSRLKSGVSHGEDPYVASKRASNNPNKYDAASPLEEEKTFLEILLDLID